MNPRVLGVRVDMLAYLYRRRLRAHPLAELLAGAGVALGVALVFGVLLANASLTSSADRLIRGLAGSARYELASRSTGGFDERFTRQAGELEGVQVAAPVLRENVTLIGPRGERAVQLIGVTASLESLGGLATRELQAGETLLKGGIGLPEGVARAIGARPGDRVRVAAGGAVHAVSVRAVLGRSVPGMASSPVAVATLPVAQMLTGRKGRVSEILIRPLPGAGAGAGSGPAGSQAGLRARLAVLAAHAHIDLRPADAEEGLLSLATKPSRQSTSLFTAIAVMIGFLLALNAMLLTVPERRRFIAELRMQGYDARQIVLLMGLQALVLGLLASLAGIGLGYALSHLFFQQVPGFLTAAFPVGAEEAVRAWMVAGALACGVLAVALASLTPLTDLRSGRPVDAAFRRAGSRSEVVGRGTTRTLTFIGASLLAGAVALALISPGLTIAAGVALALAGVCLIPAMFALLALALPRVAERARSSALIVALTEMRAITTRSVALAGIVCLAVYGGIAIGGARQDLLRGIDRATAQYFGTAQVWVTAGRDVFNTNSFTPGAAAGAIGKAPGIASVRVYRGGLLDVGKRRMWVRARPASDATILEASQLLHGDYATATRLIRGQVQPAVPSSRLGWMGGWAAVSSDFAEERHLHVGSAFTLPTPSGYATLRVAAITTNSGWPAGAITMSSNEYARLWGSDEAAALEVSAKPGVSAGQARREVIAALGPSSGLRALTATERAAQSASSARQGLRTLQEIATLLLVAAALSVASALSAAIWQRRMRLASLKIQGYDTAQLWRAVLLECGITIGAGALIGATVGLAGHALASRFLALSTGFPAPFALGPAQALLTIALFGLTALAVIALPGMAAARVSARAVLAE